MGEIDDERWERSQYAFETEQWKDKRKPPIVVNGVARDIDIFGYWLIELAYETYSKVERPQLVRLKLQNPVFAGETTNDSPRTDIVIDFVEQLRYWYRVWPQLEKIVATSIEASGDEAPKLKKSHKAIIEAILSMWPRIHDIIDSPRQSIGSNQASVQLKDKVFLKAVMNRRNIKQYDNHMMQIFSHRVRCFRESMRRLDPQDLFAQTADITRRLELDTYVETEGRESSVGKCPYI